MPPTASEPAAETEPALAATIEPVPAPTPEPAIQADAATPAAPGPSMTLAILDMLADRRGLLARSRPAAWAITALPFLVAGFDVRHGLDAGLLLGTLYFLLPYNLLLHGLDGVASPEAVRTTRLAIALTNLPILAVLVLLGGASAGVGLLLVVAVALAASLPPIQARHRPILDLIAGATIVVLSAACGGLMAGLAVSGLPWLALGALAAWTAASFALRAILDFPLDRANGVASTATALGPRPTAVIALAGYGLAVFLVAGLGRLGVFASLGLALYLLLPAMPLLAPRHDPVAMEAAGRKAWAGFLGLRFLVGAGIALLLLRYWGYLGDVLGAGLLIGSSAVAAGLAGWNIVATRLVTRRRRIRPDAERPVPPLTIVVTSSDDGDRLLACVEALLEQTYADTWILVIDQGSTDGSPDLAAGLLGGSGQVLAIEAPAPGEPGREWARRIGAESTEDELVLFVDVDTFLVPVATRILVEQMQDGRWDLLSGVTRYDMPTAGERAAVPGFALLLLGFRPIWLSALTAGRPAVTAFADASLMLLRRDAYLAVVADGDARAGVRDDRGLARAFVRGGHRVGTVHVADLAATRQVPGVGAAVGAWRRSFLPLVGGSLAMAIVAMAARGAGLRRPDASCPSLAVAVGADARAVVGSCIPLFLLGFDRFALVLTQRQPAVDGVLASGDDRGGAHRPARGARRSCHRAPAGRASRGARDAGPGHVRPARLSEPGDRPIAYHLAPDRPTRSESRRDRCAP